MSINSFRTNKKLRTWVLFALLTFMGQVVMADVYSNMMFSDTRADSALQFAVGSICHEDAIHTTEEVTQPSKAVAKCADSECCDYGCPMTECHSVSAILSSVRIETLGLHNASFFFLSQAAVIKSVSSPYRPPIFG